MPPASFLSARLTRPIDNSEDNTDDGGDKDDMTSKMVSIIINKQSSSGSTFYS